MNAEALTNAQVKPLHQGKYPKDIYPCARTVSHHIVTSLTTEPPLCLLPGALLGLALSRVSTGKDGEPGLGSAASRAGEGSSTAALVQQVHYHQLASRCSLVCLQAFVHTTVNLLPFPASWTATFLERQPPPSSPAKPVLKIHKRALFILRVRRFRGNMGSRIQKPLLQAAGISHRTH